MPACKGTAMHLAHTCSGLLSPRGLLAVALIGFLCHLSTEAFEEVQSPKIVQTVVTMSRQGGRALMSCRADPGSPDDFTLIYWLVNRTFIEMAYPGGRVHEEEERAVEENGRTLIQRDLVFQKVLEEDYRSNYTCVVNSPAGTDKTTRHLRRQNVGARRPQNQNRRKKPRNQRQAERRAQKKTKKFGSITRRSPLKRSSSIV